MVGIVPQQPASNGFPQLEHGPKQFHDVVGYYNRFDIFKLTVNPSANMPLSYDDTASTRPVSFDPPLEEEATAGRVDI